MLSENATRPPLPIVFGVDLETGDAQVRLTPLRYEYWAGCRIRTIPSPFAVSPLWVDYMLSKGERVVARPIVIWEKFCRMVQWFGLWCTVINGFDFRYRLHP